MALWNIVTTVETYTMDSELQPVVTPAGTVVNTVEWDGVSPWQPPEGTKVELVP